MSASTTGASGSSTRDWQNPTRLFTLPSSPTGITYDMNTGHPWIAHDGGVIEERTLDGTVISSFPYGTGGIGSLAWEPATATLRGVVNGRDEIRNFSRTGTLLESVNIPGLASNNWGGEFAVPEPTTALLLALGAIGALRRR